MKKILSCCPVVNKEIRHLLPSNFQFQPGKPVSAFEANIYWLQESESSVQLISGGKPNRTMGSFDDRDGYLSSIEQAYRLCEKLMDAYDLHTFSADVLQIQVDLIQTPVFELFTKEIKFSWGKGNNWRQYECVSKDWNEIQHPNQAISSKNVLKPMKQHFLLRKYVAFSSKTPVNKQISAIKDFKKKWQVQSADQPSYSKNRT